MFAAQALAAGFSFGGSFQKIFPGLIPAETQDSVDSFWMKEALAESMRGVGLTNPNPAVGCVIVKNGMEISRGHTQPYGGKHAERMAIEKLNDLSVLEGATAYVTLEPCSHHGNQPPCAELLAGLPLARVVIARLDSDERVCGRGAALLRKKGKQICVGSMAPEVTAWNYPFFRTRKSTRPFFALKWAQTLDGQLADDADQSQWISGPEARLYTHWLRQKYDCILVGAGTFVQDLPRLSVRDCVPVVRQPMKLVYDPNGRLIAYAKAAGPAFVNFLKATPAPYYVFVSTEAQACELEAISPLLVGIVAEGSSAQDRILSGLGSTILRNALAKPIQSVLVEGGPRLLSELERAGLGDLMHVFVSPRLTGGLKHRVQGQRLLAEAGAYQTVSTKQLGNDVLLELVKQGDWEDALRSANAP